MNITIISCFDINDYRVNVLKRTLEAEGHSVSVLISNFRHLQKCKRASCSPGMEMIPVRPYYGRFSTARIFSHMRFAREALARAEKLRPDVLWVLAPPNSLVREAALYKNRRPQTRLILDFMDLWPESMPVRGFRWTPAGWLWRGLRDSYINAADTVAAESDAYWRVLERHCDRQKLRTLYTDRGLRLRELKAHPPKDKIALCFLGEVNQSVDFQAVERLIRQMDSPVELHIVGDGAQAERLCRGAEDAGAEVVFHGRVYAPEKKHAIFDGCHCGLNLLTRDAGPRITMKSVDYLKNSLPMINNVEGDTWRFVERYAVGLNYDGSTGLSSANLLALQCRREQIQMIYNTYFAEKAFTLKLKDMIRG